MKTSGEHIRHRIHVETDIQRSIASLLKLATHSKDTALVDNMYSSTYDVDTMIDELHLVLSQACDCQTRYLQHLAGALAKDNLTQQQHQQPSKQDVSQKDIARLEHMVKQYAAESEYRGGDVQQMLDVLEKRLQQQHESSRIHDLQDALQRARRDRDNQIQLLEKELQQARQREHELLRKQQQQQQQPPAPPTVSTAELNDLKDALKQAKQREKELLEQSTKMQQQLQDELKLAKETERDLRTQLELPAAQIQQLKDELAQCEEKLHQMMVDKQQQQSDTTDEKVQHVQQQLDISRQHELELQKQLDDRVSLEQQISQALAATSCQSLDDMVQKIIDNNNKSSSQPSTDIEKAFKAAQEEYTRREAALMLQTASVEAELGAVLKEYDRVTRNITDFNNERKKYQSQVETLIREKQLLDKQLADKQVQEGIGRDGQTMTLRKEFRQLMATVKAEHEQAMDKEVERRRQVELELRNIKHDLEMKNWDRVSAGVQTHFVAYPL